MEEEIKSSELPSNLKPKYVYPNVRIISFRAIQRDLEWIEEIKKRIVTDKKKNYSMVIRESLDFAVKHMPRVV